MKLNTKELRAVAKVRHYQQVKKWDISSSIALVTVMVLGIIFIIFGGVVDGRDYTVSTYKTDGGQEIVVYTNIATIDGTVIEKVEDKDGVKTALPYYVIGGVFIAMMLIIAVVYLIWYGYSKSEYTDKFIEEHKEELGGK